MECVDVMGFRVRLDPMELVDRLVMFAPQLYDRREIAYMRRNLPEGGVFLDLGSNVGLYSLAAAKTVGQSGRVLAVDADPYTFAKVERTIRENEIKNIQALHVGVTDKPEVLQLHLHLSGNRGGSTFMIEGDGKNTVSVQCKPLLELLRDANIQRVDVAKLDLEGFEYRVLHAFFCEAERSLWPRHLIVERNADFNALAGLAAIRGDVNELLAARGYVLQLQHDVNYVWALPRVPWGPRDRNTGVKS
jgi:FkbM family methyltransferase